MKTEISFSSEQDAIRTFRRAGEVAARSVGLQPCDADAVGVDFAAYMVTRRTEKTPRYTGAFVAQAARWFAVKEARHLHKGCQSAGQASPPVEELPAGNFTGDPASILAAKLTCEELQRAVGKLSQEEQAVLQVFLAEDSPATEAASQLGCTPAAARKRLQRVRGRLRQLLVNG